MFKLGIPFFIIGSGLSQAPVTERPVALPPENQGAMASDSLEPAGRESVIAIVLDGNTEAAFSAEFVPALGTEIRMGFVPISICW
jgi:hypothetical protein